MEYYKWIQTFRYGNENQFIELFKDFNFKITSKLNGYIEFYGKKDHREICGMVIPYSNKISLGYNKLYYRSIDIKHFKNLNIKGV